METILSIILIGASLVTFLYALVKEHKRKEMYQRINDEALERIERRRQEGPKPK